MVYGGQTKTDDDDFFTSKKIRKIFPEFYGNRNARGSYGSKKGQYKILLNSKIHSENRYPILIYVKTGFSIEMVMSL